MPGGVGRGANADRVWLFDLIFGQLPARDLRCIGMMRDADWSCLDDWTVVGHFIGFGGDGTTNRVARPFWDATSWRLYFLKSFPHLVEGGLRRGCIPR